MKPRILMVLMLLLCNCRTADQSQGVLPQTGKPVEVFFSPRGGCTEAVVHELNGARASIFIQAYSFTSAPIAKAIIDAAKRGVKVEAVLDRSNRTDKYSAATFLRNQACDVRIDAKHAIAHNKIMIIDERVVLTGSFNFTKQAEDSNAENLLVFRGNPDLVAKYLANFRLHQAHSEPYDGPTATDEVQERPAKPARSRQRR